MNSAREIVKILEFFMIFVQKNNKIPLFYMISPKNYQKVAKIQEF